MFKFLAPLLILMTVSHHAFAKKIPFDFQFEAVTLDGVINLPDDEVPKGIVLIVHGDGPTNAVDQDWHADVRGTMVAAGYATFMWDKMGCGKSEGEFNANQTVHSSASEVMAAIAALQEKAIPGAHTVGLWGISRAGWICPLIINQYQNIAFWISVSGVDGKESFGYLFEQNLRINGHPEKEISHLVEEWKKGNEITHQGGRYDEYLAATEQLRKNSFIQRFNGGRQVTEEGFYNYQEFFKQQLWDTTAQLQIYIEDFESLLAKVNCPVLALFGEQDMTVDWQKTKALYERILSPQRLVIESFPRCNHNLFQCKTGGFYEFEDNNLAWNRCDGFLDTMTNWLQKLGN